MCSGHSKTEVLRETARFDMTSPDPIQPASSPLTVMLAALAVVIPVSTWLLLPMVPAVTTPDSDRAYGSAFEMSEVRFNKTGIGPEVIGHPRICHVQITRLEPTGPVGVLVCDAARNAVLFYAQEPDGNWTEEVLLSDVVAPAHTTVVDIDQDDDLDILVSVLGNIEPDDGVIGSVVLLERRPQGYQPITILDDVRRVADVQPGDFDHDGDTDLAVGVFGYNRGQVLWLENLGSLAFRDHELLSAPGIIHVPVADFDNDGDLDISAVVTQDEEEVWGFENDGTGQFLPRRLWFTVNFDLGSAGLLAEDLDRDGDVDLILPAGDNLEDFDPFPQPYHGCLWFENTGNWTFEVRRIATFGGTYAAATGDIDGDNDTDVVLVSMANVWDEPSQGSIVWLENDGQQQFRTWQIDSAPTHLVTVATGDLNGDGATDIVAGGLHIRPPYDRIGRVTAWFNSGASP